MARSNGGSTADPKQAIVVRPPPSNNGKDAFASLPPDQRSPDKESSSGLLSSTGSGATAVGKGDTYAHLLENPFVTTAEEAVSGFSAGVDTASYSNIRRFLTHGKLPPKGAVRIEEMLNYFPLKAAAGGDGPVGLAVEIGTCPWKPERRLARICVQARELPSYARPAVNLVFVIDVSDSMRSEKTRLPLLKQAMHLVVGKLSARDRLSIIAYSKDAAIVLQPTVVEDKAALWAAIDRLEFAGQPAASQGMETAYELASRGFIRGGVNRIILATDGAWNVGATDHSRLLNVVRQKSREGVSLTVLGVGMNNLKDATMEKLAAAGAGSYAYIDTLAEAKKVLVDQIDGSLVAVASDVKVQVTFNPSWADSYRLIGYERRVMSREDLGSQSTRGGELARARA